MELTELGEQRLEGAELGLQVGDGLRGQGGGQGRVLFRSGFRSVQGAETDLAAGHHELFSRLGGDMMVGAEFVADQHIRSACCPGSF